MGKCWTWKNPTHPSPAQLLKAPVPPLPICKGNKEYKDGPSSISMIIFNAIGGDLQVKLNVGDVMTGVHRLGNDVLFQVPDD